MWVRRIVSALVIFGFFSASVFAYRTEEPSPISKWDCPSFSRLNHYLHELWNITNGRYNLDALTANPNGTRQGTTGELVYATYGGDQYICVNSSTPSPGTTWTCVNITTFGSICGSTANTQILFNDGGSCGGDSDLTWNKTTNLLTVGSGGDILFSSTSPVSTNTISVANQTVANVNASDINIIGGVGNGTGTGTDILIESGQGGTSGNGGNIDLLADNSGSTSGLGGSITLTAGNGASGTTAGTVALIGGNGITGSNVDGGYVTLLAGDGSGTGLPGIVQVQGQSDTIADGTQNYPSFQLQAYQWTMVSGGSATALRNAQIGRPTYAGVAGGATETVTGAYTLYIQGAPIQSNSVVEDASAFYSDAQAWNLNSGQTLTTHHQNQFLAPTLQGVVGGAVETVTNSSTVYINSAPLGSNVTFTNGPYAFWVDAGETRLDGVTTMASGIVVGDTNGTATLYSGVWSPTTNNIANLDSSSAAEGQYLRVGLTVSGSIQLTVNPNLTATSTELELDLPVTSNFGATSDASGSCAAPGISGMSAAVTADVSSNELEVRWVAGDITNQELDCSFSYQII